MRGADCGHAAESIFARASCDGGGRLPPVIAAVLARSDATAVTLSWSSNERLSGDDGNSIAESCCPARARRIASGVTTRLGEGIVSRRPSDVIDGVRLIELAWASWRVGEMFGRPSRLGPAPAWSGRARAAPRPASGPCSVVEVRWPDGLAFPSPKLFRLSGEASSLRTNGTEGCRPTTLAVFGLPCEPKPPCEPEGREGPGRDDSPDASLLRSMGSVVAPRRELPAGTSDRRGGAGSRVDPDRRRAWVWGAEVETGPFEVCHERTNHKSLTTHARG